MAVDMFMKIDGIKGESQDAKHKDEIAVLAWSWGLSNSGSSHATGGGTSGKANFQDLSFTKYVDSASSPLQLSCATGKHIPKASLVVRKAGGTALEYITITLEDLIVSAVSTGGSGGEDRLTENVTLNFAKVKFSYQPQDAKGAKAGGAIDWGYDLKKNAKV